MKKDISSLSMFEIEELNCVVDDFEQILKDKDEQTNKIFSSNNLDSTKCEQLRSIVSSLISYESSLNTIKLRIKKYLAENKDCKFSNEDKSTIKQLKSKINKYLKQKDEIALKCVDLIGLSNTNIEV